MRTRIHPTAICGSRNYQASRRMHWEYLKRIHKDRLEVINLMTFSIENLKVNPHVKPFIQIFGKRLYLNPSEIDRAKNTEYEIYHE